MLFFSFVSYLIPERSLVQITRVCSDVGTASDTRMQATANPARAILRATAAATAALIKIRIMLMSCRGRSFSSRAKGKLGETAVQRKALDGW